jgi:uncharacterized SAM-binding protein YcdF (DUF218 family)
MTKLIDPIAFLWFVFLGLGILFLNKRQLLAGISTLLVVLVMWAVEVAQVPARLLAGLEEQYVGLDPSEPLKGDAIVVLGGFGSASDHEITGIDFGPAIDRDLTAITLARQGAAKVLVVGGGGWRADSPEGQALANWIEDWKLTKAEVVVLPGSRNTHDEAVHSAALAEEREWDRVILVTSGWHLKRASAAFRKAGLAVEPFGCDFQGSNTLQKSRCYVPQSQSYVLLQVWLHEVVGYLWYRVRGWV